MHNMHNIKHNMHTKVVPASSVHNMHNMHIRILLLPSMNVCILRARIIIWILCIRDYSTLESIYL